MSKASDTLVTPYVPAQRRMVTLPLTDIQDLRDKVMRMRDYHPHMRALFGQLVALYDRCAKQHSTSAPQNHQHGDTAQGSP